MSPERSRNPELWRKRFPDEVTCVRCLQIRPLDELDRLLWCEACVSRAQERAKSWGWIFGAVVAVGLAIWIWVEIRPSDVIIGGWIATVLAAFWLGARLGRELFFGVMRFRNRRAAEAVPPAGPPDIEPSDEE